MDQIFVYSDSLSWGIIPGTRRRHPTDVRWPGVLEAGLGRAGSRVRVIEDCLNGRRTVLDDPFKAGRNGLDDIAPRIESHAPLRLVILMLGTNDFQSMHVHRAWHAGQGIAALIDAVRTAPVEPGMPVAPILVVAPPLIRSPRGPIASKFLGAEEKCAGLADAYREVARERGCAFFDAETVVSASAVDGVHLDAEAHIALAEALVGVVRPLLAASPVGGTVPEMERGIAAG